MAIVDKQRQCIRAALELFSAQSKVNEARKTLDKITEEFEEARERWETERDEHVLTQLGDTVSQLSAEVNKAVEKLKQLEQECSNAEKKASALSSARR